MAATKAGVLQASEAEILLPAFRLYQSLIQLLRLSIEGTFDPKDAPRALLDRLAPDDGHVSGGYHVPTAARSPIRAGRRQLRKLQAR